MLPVKPIPKEKVNLIYVVVPVEPIPENKVNLIKTVTSSDPRNVKYSLIPLYV